MATRGGRIVFLTGVTGFVGKVVLFDLLRRRRELDVSRVFVLIRPNRKGSPEERFEREVRGASCFRGWEATLDRHVSVVAGDLSEPRCGLTEDAEAELGRWTTHIIHCAASVDFDLPLEDAANANITSCLEVAELARRCSSLQSIVAVSTAYVTPHTHNTKLVPERLAPMPFAARKVYDSIVAGEADRDELLEATGHPNTYTFTKCLTEHILAAEYGDLPLRIVRPSIISASVEYPSAGWIDSYAAFAGFVALVGSGRLRTLVCDEQTRLDLVPCDVVSRVIIEEAFTDEDPHQGALPIRHAVAGISNACTIESCWKITVDWFGSRPAEKRPNLYHVGSPDLSYRFTEALHHTLPGLAGSAWLGLVGNKKLKRQLNKLTDVQHYLNRGFRYFTTSTFDFETTRPTVSEDFNRRDYIETVCRGVYRHLLNLDEREVKIAGRKHRDGVNDLIWASEKESVNTTIRAFGYVLRKLSRHCVDQITYDHTAFANARESVGRDRTLVIVPTHRSYTDFLLCSYLFFTKPELGIAIPHIAADAQFRELPVLGFLFEHARAFYLRRGLGRVDEELNQQVARLVEHDSTLQFFIEGGRSRSRQFLQPKRGLLRCLQDTGRKFAILPVAISYDRIPEERALLEEIAGLDGRRMQMTALMRWFASVMRGDVDLGRIHMSCGKALELNPETKIDRLSRDIMKELQASTAVTTHHIRCFVRSHQIPGVDEAWLRREIESRGADVVESQLDEPRVPKLLERSLRHQWAHWFHADAKRRFAGDPAIAHHIASNRFSPVPRGKERRSMELDEVLGVLFEPVRRDYRAVGRLLRDCWRAESQGVDLDYLKEVTKVDWRPNVDHALDFYVREGVIEAQDDGQFVWGKRAELIETMV